MLPGGSACTFRVCGTRGGRALLRRVRRVRSFFYAEAKRRIENKVSTNGRGLLIAEPVVGSRKELKLAGSVGL